jgi:hypothetical protein
MGASKKYLFIPGSSLICDHVAGVGCFVSLLLNAQSRLTARRLFA